MHICVFIFALKNLLIINRPYKNFILSVPEDLHQQIVDYGKLLLNFSSHNVYEYVDIIQCRLCWRFGHVKYGCSYKEVCKTCGKTHPKEEECAICCANCTRQNALSNNNKLNTSHLVTSERCPCYINRVERLKNFHSGQ